MPYMETYKRYLNNQERGESARLLSNVQEDYKKDIAEKAAILLDSKNWNESEIGKGSIGDRAIKAVQRNMNLIGRFQVSTFSAIVKEEYAVSEQLLFNLYHNRKDKECFEQICKLFGRKYDLVAYLYYILDPSRYLPLRSSIFDGIFKKLGIDLQTSGRCSWDNYQDYLSTVAAVRDALRDYYQNDDIDLLDAHSFLWTLNLDVLDMRQKESGKEDVPIKKKVIEIGASVLHKDYGEGTITKITEDNVYVGFEKKQRIFPYPKAFEKEYLKLI